MGIYLGKETVKLHLIEGLPAVGKSTYSYCLKSELESLGIHTVYFKEETSQPVDLFRQAVLTKAEYSEIVKMKLPDDFLRMLEDNTYSLGDYFIVAYTQLNYDSQLRKTILPIMRNFDVGDGRVDFESYQKLHFLLWKNFIENSEKRRCSFIAEGALLHNQLLDIIGFYDLSDEIIMSYFSGLIDIISPIKPHLYYIYPSNIETLIDNALSERGCGEGTWGYGFFRWLQLSPYGKRLNLSGKDGLTSVCRRLNELSLQILGNSGLDVDMIERKM